MNEQNNTPEKLSLKKDAAKNAPEQPKATETKSKLQAALEKKQVKSSATPPPPPKQPAQKEPSSKIKQALDQKQTTDETEKEHLSLQIRPEMERTPQKKLKGGPRLAGKEPEQAKARENTELIKGANTKLKRCPKCRNEVEAESILCEECGYNFKTGKTQLTPARKKKLCHRLELTFWMLILGLVLFSWLQPRSAKKLYTSTLGSTLTPLYEIYLRPYLTGEYDPELRAWAINQEPKVAPDKTPQTSTLTPEQIQKLRQAIVQETDQLYPLLSPGENAHFITLDKKSALAAFVKIEAGKIFLDLDGKTSSGPLEKLTPETRLRVDPEYRAIYIAEKLEQRTKELQ